MASKAYTSLERFLLFRRLYPFKKEGPSFGRVSEALKQDEILLSSDAFDVTRLEPDVLQDLYLQTLKDEVKALTRGDQDEQPSQNLRKQRLPSPRLDNLDEAAQYTHLLPQLVDRLYFDYQRNAVEAIRREEHNYHSLQYKGGEEERAERGKRPETSTPLSRSPPHGVPSIQTLLRHDEEEGAQDLMDKRPSRLKGASYQDHSPSVTNGAAITAPSSAGPEARLPSNDPRQVPPSGYPPIPVDTAPTHQTSHQYSTPSYPLPPPGSEVHRRRSSQPVPSPSPRLNQASIPPPERSSASPIILPPVSGMLRSQPSPAGPVEAANDGSQTYRPSPNMSPRLGQPSVARPHNNQIPTTRNYSHPPYSYHDGRQYPPYHSYGQQGYYPQYTGPASGLPPPSSYSTSPGYPTPGPANSTQHTGYYPPQGYYNQPAISTPYSQQQPTRYTGHQTPKSDGTKRTLSSVSVKTSTSTTKWKDVDLGRGVNPPGSPTRPLSREVSPISNRDDSPEQDTTPARLRAAKTQGKGDLSAYPAKTASTRGRVSRGVGRPSRAGSASASARGRTRSQSLTSPFEDFSADAKALITRRIKAEPSVASAHEDETSTMDESSRKPARRRRGTTKEDDRPATPRIATKRKRGNSSLPLRSPSLLSNPGFLSPVPKVEVFEKPGYVLATRNLPKISSTLMQTVTGHRDAYLFAKPLTERDAPGYNKLIFRPQDFKALKAALVAGSKAVAATVEEAEEEMMPGTKSIWIPETEEVVPPRGIVNSAQLEKEILRIFANAVMFNPELDENRGLGPAFQTRARTLKGHQSGSMESDESEDTRFEIGVAKPVDGAVVNDTRKMYMDVEEALDAWRGIGQVDDAEARAAPVIGRLHNETERENKDEEDGSEQQEEKDVIEEPRPKRRRRQL